MEHQREKKAVEPRLTIRITRETHKKLRRLSVDRETSVQALLTPAIESVASQQP